MHEGNAAVCRVIVEYRETTIFLNTVFVLVEHTNLWGKVEPVTLLEPVRKFHQDRKFSESSCIFFFAEIGARKTVPLG